MITTLLIDFSRVLVFPKSPQTAESVSQTYHTRSGQGEAFSSFLDLNEELVTFVRDHHEYPAHIFSASSKQMLEEVCGFLIPPFKSFISASHENLPKSDPDSYKEVAFRLGIKPDELLFIDDSANNLSAAHSAGVTTIEYTSNERLFEELRVALPIRD